MPDDVDVRVAHGRLVARHELLPRLLPADVQRGDDDVVRPGRQLRLEVRFTFDVANTMSGLSQCFCQYAAAIVT